MTYLDERRIVLEDHTRFPRANLYTGEGKLNRIKRANLKGSRVTRAGFHHSVCPGSQASVTVRAFKTNCVL